jgi:hypothetical protein
MSSNHASSIPGSLVLLDWLKITPESFSVVEYVKDYPDPPAPLRSVKLGQKAITR